MSTTPISDVTFVAMSADDLVVTATYVVKGWLVFVQWDIGSPFDGPSTVRVEFDLESLDMTVGSSGIGVEVLRAIPMRDAAQRIATHVAERAVEALGPKERAALGGRASSPTDHAKFAALYVRAIEVDRVQNPVRHLTEMSRHLAASTHGKPLTRSGISARLKRARDMGLLNRDTNYPSLTAEGLDLLKDT